MKITQKKCTLCNEVKPMCVYPNSKETLNVEGQLESAYNHDVLINPNGQ